MKVVSKLGLIQISSAILLCCGMSACTSLQSQMSSYDSEIKACAEDGRWNAANRVIDHAQFKCEPYEMKDVEAWRKRERMGLRLAFAKSLTAIVSEANTHYSQGNLTEGDKVRLKLKDRYFGGRTEGDSDNETMFSKLFKQDKSLDTGVPEELAPCLELAWINMLSDRNIARMIIAYNGLAKRIEAIDVQGRKKSIKELDSIREGFKKVGKWKDKIDLFMEKLADPEIARWAPTDRSTYAQFIKKMESVRGKVADSYKVKRWNTCVFDRKEEYKEISELTAAGDYAKGMQILKSHDLLLSPIGLPGCVDFDDVTQRTKVVNGELSNYKLMEILNSGTNPRVDKRFDPRSGRLLSALIYACTIVDDPSDKRQRRAAVRVAQLQAQKYFVEDMEITVSSEMTKKESEEDDQFHSSFSSIVSSSAKADLSNLVLLVSGIYNDYVIVILGWRDPALGNVPVALPKKVDGELNIDVSSSFGAYL